MRLWRKRDELYELERELRARRPEPRHEFARALEQRVHRSRYRSLAPGFRLGLAGAVTAAMVVALAAVGGLGYAASTVTQVAQVATNLVQPQSQTGAAGPNAASQQYGKKVHRLRRAAERQAAQHLDLEERRGFVSGEASEGLSGRLQCRKARGEGERLRQGGTQVRPVWVPPGKVSGYMKRNSGSYKAKKGKC